MIQFKQVTKRYPGGHSALVRVSFHIACNEMLFVTGHSGAGKSTLLKLILMLERPSSGDIIINGQSLCSLARRHIPAIRRNIGTVFQNHQLLADRTVFDNVALPLIIAGLRCHDIRRRVNTALDKVGLLHKAQSMSATLSGGEQQRVSIARAVVHKPAILLADEPTGDLDPGLSVDIIDLLRQFNEMGVTVLIASHDLNLMARSPYRVLTLRWGCLVPSVEEGGLNT